VLVDGEVGAFGRVFKARRSVSYQLAKRTMLPQPWKTLTMRHEEADLVGTDLISISCHLRTSNPPTISLGYFEKHSF
jgi:hypothetical protein